MGDGLIGRMLRALRLDPTLYREVAAPGASTEQAALALMLAAVGFSLASVAPGLATWLNSGWWTLPVEANVPFVMEIAERTSDSPYHRPDGRLAGLDRRVVAR